MKQKSGFSKIFFICNNAILKSSAPPVTSLKLLLAPSLGIRNDESPFFLMRGIHKKIAMDKSLDSYGNTP
jgi:hypothetical protein